MAPELIGIIAIVLMFFFMAMGMPIAICMAVVGLLGTSYLVGIDVAINGLASVVWVKCYDFVLSTVPMFVLMGYFVYHAGISSELFKTFRNWFGWIPGGLAMATISACAFFAAATGSSVASAATMGVVCLPEMDQYNYDKKLSTGSIAAGGTLGILIPPSTVFIIYGILTEQSIGKLFMAGILPGVILALLFVFSVYLSVKISIHQAPAVEKSKFDYLSLKGIVWVLVLFVLVIGGIYSGIMTPTEAGAIGAFGAFLISVARKKLSLQKLNSALVETLRTTCFIFAIIIGAFILNYFMAITRLPAMLAQFTSSLDWPPSLILMFIFFVYIVLGCVMDALAMVVITMPIFFPTIIALGYDPIWFGVVVVIIFELALITPPIGMNCYILSGVAKDTSMDRIFLGVFMFMPALIVLILLLFLFPQIALFLPNTMG